VLALALDPRLTFVFFASMAAAPVARAVAAGAANAPLQPGGVERSTSGLKRGTSHYDLEYNGELNEQQIKVGFIRKVYGILAGQIGLTTAIIAAFCFVDPVQKVGLGILQSGWLNIAFLVTMFPMICAMMAYKDQYPTNFTLLMVFTTLMGAYLGIICGAFMAAGKGMAILSAAGATALIFALLSVYVWYSDTDFSFLGGFLFVALFANIIIGLFAMWFGMSGLMWFYHVFGVLIFSGYILYDTDQIVNKVQLEDCDTGTAIWGATELYLDLVNLFLHLLALFGDRD
jgi:hypothetical protein